MKIPFTPQLLGDLIEKGYKYMLAGNAHTAGDTNAPIILKAVKQEPILLSLPEGYNTYYRITREPMQMACGIDGTPVFLDHSEGTEPVTRDDVYNDSYFRMSEDFFKQVLESIEDYAVFTTDKNGDVNSWNAGAEHVLGYTEPEILGISAGVFFTPEDLAKGEDKNELDNAIKYGRAIDERYHVCKDGTRFWGTGLVFPLLDEGQIHRGFTKIMRNRQEENESQQKAKDE